MINRKNYQEGNLLLIGVLVLASTHMSDFFCRKFELRWIQEKSVTCEPAKYDL